MRTAADPAAFYEEHQEWSPEVRSAVAAWLLAQAPPAPRRCLFLGAATGVNEVLPFARVADPRDRLVAGDIDAACLARLRERAAAEGRTNVEALRIDVRRDLEGAGAFDLVTLLFVVHRLDDWRPVVAPLASLVAPGGSLVVSEFAGPCGLIFRSNEGGGAGDGPVARLVRRYFELLPGRFDPPLTSTRIGPVREALAGLLRPAGRRDFEWRQRLTVGGVLRRIELRAYAPYFSTDAPPGLLEQLRREFEPELDREAECVETIRLHRFAR